jgi:hypothetical protein
MRTITEAYETLWTRFSVAVGEHDKGPMTLTLEFTPKQKNQ